MSLEGSAIDGAVGPQARLKHEALIFLQFKHCERYLHNHIHRATIYLGPDRARL